jgi:hypothetical protein
VVSSKFIEVLMPYSKCMQILLVSWPIWFESDAVVLIEALWKSLAGATACSKRGQAR